jgi:hypothetical protein
VRRVLPEPPLGQVGAGEERRSRFALNVVEEAGERADTPWPSDDAGMKADGHELGVVVALPVERVEGVTKGIRKNCPPVADPDCCQNLKSFVSGL